jgi:hypothetical protein
MRVSPKGLPPRRPYISWSRQGSNEILIRPTQIRVTLRCQTTAYRWGRDKTGRTWQIVYEFLLASFILRHDPSLEPGHPPLDCARS